MRFAIPQATHRKSIEEQHITRAKPASDPIAAFDFDHSPLDHDERASPLLSYIWQLGAWRNHDLLRPEQHWDGLVEQGQHEPTGRCLHERRVGRWNATQRSGRKLVTSTIFPASILSTFNPASLNSAFPLARR